MKHNKYTKPINQAGFTIVELMIATVVFSMILLVITVGVVSFSNQYYRSVNASATQSTTREVMDTISQAIQFSSAAVTLPGSGNYFCAGGYVFSFSRANLYTGGALSAANPGLYMQPAGTGCANPTTFTAGKQLLSKNQRVTQLSVTQSGSLYTVEVGIAYGDTELLCSTASGVTAGNCNGSGVLSTGNMWGSNASKLSCYGGNGAAYCATSLLKTVVEKRLGT